MKWLSSLREGIRQAIQVRLAGVDRAKLSASSIAAVSTPTTRAIEKLKAFFEMDMSRNELYIKLTDLDPKLQSSINTAAIIVDRCMKGFRLRVDKEVDEREKKLQIELENLHKILKPYIYDIAYKTIRDGDSCFLFVPRKSIGISSLIWLPIDQLTVLESKSQATRLIGETIQEANFYVLNEIPTHFAKRQEFKAENIAHFNWGRQEKIRDRYNRLTLGIFNDPPLEALTSTIIWRFSILINDMLWRDVNVPREHHQLPSEPFNARLFSGDTYEAQLAAAQGAADAATLAYAKKLEGRRVDRGYVTLNNVKIDVVESKITYNAPNNLIDQLNQDVFGSIGVPESAILGRSRGTYATELALESYLLVKAEFLATKLAERFVKLAKRHLDVKTNKSFVDLYHKIEYDVQLIFFPREMSRTVSIMRETGLFTNTELRAKFGYLPLTEEQEADIAHPIGYKSTESSTETAETAKRSTKPKEPTTDQSTDQQQKT